MECSPEVMESKQFSNCLAGECSVGTGVGWEGGIGVYYKFKLIKRERKAIFVQLRSAAYTYIERWTRCMGDP